jgi:hypothetical protein
MSKSPKGPEPDPDARYIPTAREDLVNFLNAIGNVHADRVNPAFKSRYASLPEILDSVKSVAKLYHLAPQQRLGREPGHVVVITEIIHKDGTTFPAGEVAFKSDGLNPQQLASATTYLRRLCLKTAVGIETDVDDDGAAASRLAPAKPATPAGPWYAFLTAVEAERAHAYCVKKGWLSPNAQDLIELPQDKVDAILANKAAFTSALNR